MILICDGFSSGLSDISPFNMQKTCCKCLILHSRKLRRQGINLFLLFLLRDVLFFFFSFKRKNSDGLPIRLLKSSASSTASVAHAQTMRQYFAAVSILSSSYADRYHGDGRRKSKSDAEMEKSFHRFSLELQLLQFDNNSPPSPFRNLPLFHEFEIFEGL